MKTQLSHILVVAFIFLAISCNKNSDDTVKEQLSGKTWKITNSGIDLNANGVPDGSELQPVDPAFNITGYLYENGTGSITFSTPDTSGTFSFNWVLDESNTYITSTIPAISKTTISQILSVTNSTLSLVVDNSADVKAFAYMEKQ